jgi:urease accessory protein
MIRASEHLPAGQWTEASHDSVTLNQDQRDRRRIVLTSDRGLEFLLDLPARVLLRHGDALLLEDGRRIEVHALPEPLLEVCTTDARHMLRLAWHLGNRHLEAQIDQDRILIRRDQVIAEMLENLGARVREVVEVFNPEGGAYDQAQTGRTGGHSHDSDRHGFGKGPEHRHDH